MKSTEWSNEFDIFYNSITSNKAPGLDEYEKSVILTEAQYIIVRELLSGTYSGRSIEEVEDMRRSLDSLYETDNPIRIEGVGIDPNSTLYKPTKNNIWSIIYESAQIENCCPDKSAEVIPVKHDQWHRIKNNPFRGPSKKRVLRIDYGNNKLELISKYPIESYSIRYIRKPSPIILAPLGELSIEGINEVTECELNSILHRAILDRGVRIAASIYSKGS